jgi:hypothetical protein
LPSLTTSRLHPAMVSERKEFPRMGVLLISSRDCFDGLHSTERYPRSLSTPSTPPSTLQILLHPTSMSKSISLSFTARDICNCSLIHSSASSLSIAARVYPTPPRLSFSTPSPCIAQYHAFWCPTCRAHGDSLIVHASVEIVRFSEYSHIETP